MTGGRYHEGASGGGIEYDDGMTSSTRQASRMEERNAAPAEAPKKMGAREQGRHG